MVAPIWAADNTLVHEDGSSRGSGALLSSRFAAQDPSAAPNIADISLPAGYNRKADAILCTERYQRAKQKDFQTKGIAGHSGISSV